MAEGHVQIAPDSSGKDIDADAIVSTETGNPTVYRQDVVIADSKNYSNKLVVDVIGRSFVREESLLQVSTAILLELRRANMLLGRLGDFNVENSELDDEFV